MVIRLKKKLFFKPRRCPMCGKRCYFCDWWTAVHCKKCAKKHRLDKKHAKIREARKTHTYKYTKSYFCRRKRLIEEHPYCSLCGCTENLTTHHVGGKSEHLTVLCDKCHQQYEAINNKRKGGKKW